MLTGYLMKCYCTSGELLCLMSAVWSDDCSSEDLKRDNMATAEKLSQEFHKKSHTIDQCSKHNTKKGLHFLNRLCVTNQNTLTLQTKYIISYKSTLMQENTFHYLTHASVQYLCFLLKICKMWSFSFFFVWFEHVYTLSCLRVIKIL
jgi:hypothetical protein